MNRYKVLYSAHCQVLGCPTGSTVNDYVPVLGFSRLPGIVYVLYLEVQCFVLYCWRCSAVYCTLLEVQYSVVTCTVLGGAVL